MKFTPCLAAALTSAALGMAGASHAAIVVTAGNGGGGNLSNVLLSGCTDTRTGATNTVQGCLNSDSSLLVEFTAPEPLRATASGQASLEASDGGLQSLTISLAALNATFSTLVLNIRAATDGLVTFHGMPGNTSEAFALKGNGSNFFTITGEDFRSVRLDATGAFDIVTDIRQVRLGGLAAPSSQTSSEVPEPASLALLGLGLIGIGAARRWRKAEPA